MQIDPAIEFTWPNQPPEAWWLSQGAALKLDEGQIKFAAAMYLLGGADSKKNSRAATLAGLNIERTAAFRLARSVGIRRLLTMAEEIKASKRSPVSEEEVDRQIDKLIRSPDALTLRVALSFVKNANRQRKRRRKPTTIRICSKPASLVFI
jgi:hypothetical protein